MLVSSTKLFGQTTKYVIYTRQLCWHLKHVTLISKTSHRCVGRLPSNTSVPGVPKLS